MKKSYYWIPFFLYISYWPLKYNRINNWLIPKCWYWYTLNTRWQIILDFSSVYPYFVVAVQIPEKFTLGRRPFHAIWGRCSLWLRIYRPFRLFFWRRDRLFQGKVRWTTPNIDGCSCLFCWGWLILSSFCLSLPRVNSSVQILVWVHSICELPWAWKDKNYIY